MAKVSQAREVLRGLRGTVSAKVNGRFPVQRGNIRFNVKDEDLDRYLEIRDRIAKPEETAIFFPGHYEHVIEFQGRGPGLYRLFRDSDQIALAHPTNGFQIVIGPASSVFALSLCDSNEVHRDALRFILLRSHRYRDRDDIDIRDVLSRMIAISVRAPDDNHLATNQKQLKSIAESGLYHVAFGNGIGITLSSSWDRSAYWLDTRRREEVQFPLRVYNSELIAYYQLALGSESLILSYLALYKILEYFFTSASEEVLHDKVKSQLVGPDFSHTKVKKLRELVKVVRKFDQRMDERRMLATVLERYLDAQEVRSWMLDYEAKHGPSFTQEREVFGEKMKVDLSDDQIFSNIGSRIYHVRNALVHNKEGEISRFIPFSGQERVLARETPILLYIAEDLILRTGRDIQF
ncbi:MAG: hypothetical protein ACREVE_12635 [Gammaproteobacteria bacterium]